jgi:hypothetical protein
VLWEQLAEEIFFFQYHLRLSMEQSMRMPINLRKWMMHRYVQQRENEEKAMEAAKKRGKSR